MLEMFSLSDFDSITIIGSKGCIKVGGQYMDKVEYCNIQDYAMPELAPVNAPNDYGDYKGSAANHHYVIENVRGLSHLILKIRLAPLRRHLRYRLFHQ